MVKLRIHCIEQIRPRMFIGIVGDLKKKHPDEWKDGKVQAYYERDWIVVETNDERLANDFMKGWRTFFSKSARSALRGAGVRMELVA